MDSTQLTTAGAVLVVHGAGRWATLPLDAVEDIAAAVPAWPLPLTGGAFAGDAFEGAVPCGAALTVQLDLARAWGGSAGAGRYTMRVQTTRGPVRVRVDRVSGPVAGTKARCALAEIEALLADCVGRAVAASRPPPIATSEMKVLVLEAGGRRIAVPATDVEAVAQPLAAWSPRGSQSDERIVALATELLPGCALADWLGVPSIAPDAWAVILRADGHRLAVTAERVSLPPPVPAASVQSVRLRQGSAVWLTDAAGAPIELVPPAAFDAPAAQLVVAPNLAADPPLPGTTTLATPTPATPPAATSGGAALRSGPFDCVVPQELIAGLRAVRLPGVTRGFGAVPVFDLGVLLGRPAPPCDSPALLMLRRPGRRTVALMAETVTLAAPAADWVAVPPAPATLHALFDAARPSAAGCQLRLRGAALAQRRGGLPSAALRAAFRGWIDFAGDTPARGHECSGT